MKPILTQIQELQELLVVEKLEPITRNTEKINVIMYRLERIEKYLNENFEYTIIKKIPSHYNHRNMKV
jgi:K+/H+ antiporter YhaU regulatory subunit KhtT